MINSNPNNFTPFAQFLLASKGYEFYRSKSKKDIEKWEVFEMAIEKGYDLGSSQIRNAEFMNTEMFPGVRVREYRQW